MNTQHIWDIACISCSVGWIIGLLFIETVPRWASIILVFLMVVGFSSCAAGERVCEYAKKVSP